MRYLALSLMLPALASAEIYQCTVNGQKTFSDSPCGETSERVEVDPVTVGGQLDTGTDAEFYEAPEKRRSRSSSRDACPYINSTRMRKLIIQDKVVAGMKPGDVRKSWGSPTSINRGGGLTQWAYHWSGGSSQYVYFRNGCVTDTSSYSRF